MSAEFAIAESNVNRTIQKIENWLIQSRVFLLPKRNQYITDHDFVIVEVTESEIERPKQTNKQTNKLSSIMVKRKNPIANQTMTI